jgi:dihydroorotate dehydrogenase/NAD-dependent dihydropyrimidine dehydrogenase PreA subunit
MVDLSVKFGGVEFKNPVQIASLSISAPYSHWPAEKDGTEPQMKMWRKYYEAGVGSIVTGTIFHEDVPDARGSSRFYAARTKGFAEREGFVSQATMPDVTWGPTQGLRLVERAKKEFKDMRIIASIMGHSADGEVWGKLALQAEQAGADMLELNLCSVMVWESTERAQLGIEGKKEVVDGMSVGLVPEAFTAVVKGIKKVCSLPVIPKITPALGYFGLLNALPLYREAGADGVVCTHTIQSIVPPDIYNGGKTTFPGMSITTWWSVNGPWNRFVTYRDVPLVAKYSNMDVAAGGGLVTSEQCIEAMMFGAKLVQMSSGILWNGISFPGKVVKFMKRYMEEQDYTSVNDFIGLGLKHIAEMGEVQAEYKEQVGKLIARVDLDTCVGTESCKICLDNFCTATYEEDGVIKIIPEYCGGCNLCVIRCPHGARSLVRLDN